MMEIDPADKCELCGNSRAFHRNLSLLDLGFHAFVPSARTQDALDDRGPAKVQEPLASASTRSPKPSDLLAELKEKRSDLRAAEARVKELEDRVQRLKDRLVWAEHSVADARSLGISLGTSNLKRKVASLEKENKVLATANRVMRDTVAQVRAEGKREGIEAAATWHDSEALGLRERLAERKAIDAAKKRRYYDPEEADVQAAISLEAAQHEDSAEAIRALLTESAGEGKGER